ncbi:MAG TPA: hypothetical protein ENJ45_04840, partial [Phaeodactylibacter sp.]|nr:hypothetical protein [Phaeodactylibacter sp.]
MKNRYSYFWKLCCCFFLLGFYPYGTAQVIVTKSQKQTAAEQILRLKSGTLVIRLSSKYRNIRAIDKALENEQLKSSARKQLEKKRRQILEKQRKLNVEMVRAFAKNYDFSDYRIMYDTATSH